jgi:hypothetical protein
MQLLPSLLRGVFEWADFFDEDVMGRGPSYAFGLFDAWLERSARAGTVFRAGG